jgi:squalene-associated FAD-dependent desaturase
MARTNGVIIIGAGWAGLAAALELDRHGIPVTLLESASQPGGRARSVISGGNCIDNGQHLLIGAYRETLRLIELMGIREADVLRREPLRLQVHGGESTLDLKAPPLPAPLHLAWALLRAKGISLRDRLAALRMSLALGVNGFSIDGEMSVSELLQHHRQGAGLIRCFWEPLCLATLNTPPAIASARVFLRVLEESFSRSRHDAELLIPRVPLGELFPQSAVRYLCRHDNNTVKLKERVTGLAIADGRIGGVTTRQGQLSGSDVILAVSPEAATRLLSPVSALQPLAADIARLGSQPIVTVYLQFPPEHRLPQTMLGMSGTVAQWLFDRGVCGQPGLIAVVISAGGEHMAWDNDRLIRTIRAELRGRFPRWPEAQALSVIREKRATFECRVGIEALRPANATAVQGLWLAGDYTDTGYPATLEGAVRSGVECARRLIAQRQPSSE